MTDALTASVVHAASHTSAAAIEAGAVAIQDEPSWSFEAQGRLLGADAAAGYRLHVAPVADAWEVCPSLPGAAVAMALRAASTAVVEQRLENRLSLVWTGPPTEEISLRSTRAVLNSLIARASESLVLVSYAGYDVDDIVTGLGSAAQRGVAVTMILETKADGGLTIDAANAFQDLRGFAHFYKWPLAKREPHLSSGARLHAKCGIRDGVEALITSANLTGAAINDNMELGVLIESGPLPGRLYRHFKLLIQTQILELTQ